MICPKCNNKIKNDSKFCPRCGELFESNDIEKFSEIYNLELLKVYYPNKGERIKVNGISLLYMIFNYFYAIYCKMYKCAFYSIISLLIFLKLMPNFEAYALANYGFYFYLYFFILIACIAVYIFYIFSFERILLDNRKYRINKIIKNNPGKSFEEIKELVIKDSKNNYNGVIIAMFLTFALIMMIFYFKIYLF